MPAVQCTNPAAVNYNPNATSDDGSCFYLNKIGGICYAFQDVLPDEITDQSFTLSWGIETDNWIFLHDYMPDYYVQVREELFTLHNNRLYKHNVGINGVYYDATPKPFIVDVVFIEKDKEGKNIQLTLNALQWLTTVLNADGSEAPQDTFTHITIWNSKQCTGRVSLAQLFTNLEYANMRNTEGYWSFDNFRDKVIQEGIQFLDDIFNNFAVDTTKLSDTLPWYEQQLLEDVYMIVRFEFDNTSGKKIYLEDTQINADKSYR